MIKIFKKCGFYRFFDIKLGISGFYIILQSLIGDLNSVVIQGITMLLAVDFIVGLFKSAITKRLRSDKFVKGAIKIAVVLIMLILAKWSVLISPAVLGILDDLIYCFTALYLIEGILENLVIIARCVGMKAPFICFLSQYLAKVEDELQDSINKDRCKNENSQKAE